MVEAVMLWNEPNNLSHWDFKLDPDWKKFAEMVMAASKAIRSENPELPIVLGGLMPLTWSQCTAFRSTGTTGSFETGPKRWMKSAP